MEQETKEINEWGISWNKKYRDRANKKKGTIIKDIDNFIEEVN